MAVTVKKISLWRKEVENKPGVLAGTLEPFAGGGADLQVVMGYRYPGNAAIAAIEVYPVTGKKMVAAAQAAGMSTAAIPALLVEGDNRPGLAHGIARAMGDAGINMSFLIGQVVGRKFSAIFGFENAGDARKAAGLIKKAAAPKKK